jgi:hypothetical protein
MALRQAVAAFGALSFLGTFLLLAGAAVAVFGAKIIGERRLALATDWISRWLFAGRGLAWKVFVAAAVLLCGYAAVLFAASVGSHEWVLAPGEQKYFCEIDCHLAYSVDGMQRTRTIGTGANGATANGTFLVVAVRTWFDPRTISAHRGNGPLDPSPRAITLVDEAGEEYPVSALGQQALEQAGQSGTSLTQALRPGDSYISRVVFDVPAGGRDLRLLVASPTDPYWIGRVLIGDEGSFLHKKVFLRLPS